MTKHDTQPDPTIIDTWPALRAWRLAIHGASIKPRTKLLGLLIADHVNSTKGWQAWPSQARLAELSGDGAYRRQIRDRIAELIGAGWLHVPTAGSRGKTARYVVKSLDVV